MHSTHTWIGIGAGFDDPNPFNLIRVRDGCTQTTEFLLKNVLPGNGMALAMEMHSRAVFEDTIARPPATRLITTIK
ncbi:hypothetical protein [Pseudomonas farris]